METVRKDHGGSWEGPGTAITLSAAFQNVNYPEGNNIPNARGFSK